MPSTKGDFSSIAGIDSYEARMLQDAYDAVTASETWEFFRTFDEESFMFSRNPVLGKVNAHMKMMDQHSGSSYGFVMRVMEAIAKHGWESWAELRVASS
jgi:hypothetical protein